MTASEWQEHATQCRQVAASIEDRVARQILLDAAEDYLAMADREAIVDRLNIPAYQAAAITNGAPGLRRGR